MSPLLRRFVGQKSIPWPTPLGWALGLAVLLASGGAFTFGVHRFLAPIAPLGGELLIVEGWASDDALEQAITRFRRGGYRVVLTTGGPMGGGWPLQADIHDYAALSAARLERLGLEPEHIVRVPALGASFHRTRAAAQAVRDYLRTAHADVTRVDLFSVAVHGRRSWRIYRHVLGPHIAVGIIASPPDGYDPDRWWTSSNGVRTVVGETLAYLYSLSE